MIKTESRILRGFNDCRYPEDIKTLFFLAFESGYLLTIAEIENIWERFSNERDASWITTDAFCLTDLLAILEGSYND
jgi:hypothetical protein